jgi:hypothetical protein
MARGRVPTRQPDSGRKNVHYLFYGKAQDREGIERGEAMADRVDWHFCHNLPGRSPAVIGRQMESAALEGSGRLKRPFLHFIVSFDKADGAAGKVPQEVQREIAGKVIERMGLGEYRGLVVAHKDTENPHMHFSFCRVHPDHGRAWNDSNSGQRLQEITREIAREYGLNISKEYKEGADRITAAEHLAARREGRPAFRDLTTEERADIRGRTLAAFREARDWSDLSARLEAHCSSTPMTARPNYLRFSGRRRTYGRTAWPPALASPGPTTHGSRVYPHRSAARPPGPPGPTPRKARLRACWNVRRTYAPPWRRPAKSAKPTAKT